MSWKVSYVAVGPSAGILEENEGNWIYRLQRPADKDSFILALTNTETGQSGLFTLDVEIEPDSGIINIPSIVTEGTTPITFNVGATRPAELSFTIDGIEGTFVSGEVVTTPNAKIEVISDSLVEMVGPGAGGGIYSVRVCPSDHDLMLLACDMGGCYRSTNGGKTWTLLHSEEMNNHHGGPGAQFLPDGKRIIWPGKSVSGGTDKIMVSHNTGATWEQVAILPTRFVRLTDSATTVRYNSPICAAIIGDGCLVGTKLDGLLYFKMEDNSFTVVDNSMESNEYGDPRGVWFLELEGDYGYYVTGKDLRKFTYANGTFSTKTIYTAPDYIVGFGCRNGLFLITIKDDGVYLSEDECVTWNKVDDFKWQIWIHVTPSGTFYTAPAATFYLYTTDVFSATTTDRNGKPIWKSVDKGVTWKEVFDINVGGNVERTWIQTQLYWSYYFMLNGFVVIPGDTPDEDYLWASSQGELFRSIDGGGSWTCPYRVKVGEFEGRDRNQSIGLEVTTCWGVTENTVDPNVWHGLWTDITGQFSPDKGKTWVCASDGVPTNNRNTLYGVAFDPDIPGRVWGAWAQTHDIPNDGFVTGVSGNGGVYTSTDYGLTWGLQYTKGVTGPASQNCTDIVYDPYSGALYVCIYGQMYDETQQGLYNNAGVWKSMDKGDTWVRKSTGLDPGATGNLHVYRLKVGANGTIYALITLYASVLSMGGIYKTTNGGDSWEKIGPTGPAGTTWDRWLTSFAFGTTEDDIYVTAVDNQTTTAGLLVTHDGGATWQALWTRAILAGTGRSYDYCQSVYVEGDFIIMGASNTGPWISWNGGKTWEIWRDFPYVHIQSITKLRDGRMACAVYGAGILIVDMPIKGGTFLRPSSGVIKVTRLNDTEEDLSLNFKLTDINGRERSTKTLVRLGQ